MDATFNTERQIATRWVVRCMVVAWGLFFAAPTHAQAITTTPTSLSFTSTAEGTTSASKSVTVQNTGTKTLNFTSFTLSGTNATSFTFSRTCGTSLGAGKTCTVSVSFSPKSSPGTLTANLAITSNATNGTKSIALSGVSAAPLPVLVLSPTSIGFGSVGTGTTSGPRFVVVTNTGKGTLTFTAVASLSSTTQGFAISSNGCSAPLVQNGSCTIGVTFTPASAGAKSASLRIPTNASATAAVALTGSGVTPTPVLTLSATRLTFTCSTPYGGPVTAGVSATNTGTAAVAIGSIGITAGAPFFTQTNTCPASLAVGSACNIAVTFAPTGKTSRTGTLSVISTNAGTKTVSLSGTCRSHPSP
ncbi:MAG: hypothetical protein RJB26_1578 [Pseudomonadota bacterium]